MFRNDEVLQFDVINFFKVLSIILFIFEICSGFSVYSSVVFARYIPSLLATVPVCFLSLLPKPVFLRTRHRRQQEGNKGERYLHMNLEGMEEIDRSRQYLEVTLQVVQGEPFRFVPISLSPQH
jgi:hypothetical protein